MNVFAVRAGELIQDRPELAAAVAPLLKTREVIERQIADLDRKVMRMARNDIQVRRFMTVPGVRPITALCIGRQSTTQPGSRNREVLEPMPG